MPCRQPLQETDTGWNLKSRPQPDGALGALGMCKKANEQAIGSQLVSSGCSSVISASVPASRFWL